MTDNREKIPLTTRTPEGELVEDSGMYFDRATGSIRGPVLPSGTSVFLPNIFLTQSPGEAK